MDESQFEIVVKFQDEDEILVPDDTTTAETTIYAGNDCLTCNMRPRQRIGASSEFVRGPVAGLADWLIENWSPIFWEMHVPSKRGPAGLLKGSRDADGPEIDDNYEWDQPAVPLEAFSQAGSYSIGEEEDDEAEIAGWRHRHQFGHATSELAIPLMLFAPEDQHVRLLVDRLDKEMNASVDFVTLYGVSRSFTYFDLDPNQLKKALKEFVDKTIERASRYEQFAGWSNWLAERWKTAQADEENYGQRLRWMLGELGGDRVEDLKTSEPRLAKSLEQILLDCKLVSREDELPVVEGLVQKYALKDASELDEKEIPGWQNAVREYIDTALPDFAQGYHLARKLRKKMNLDVKPVTDITLTAEKLDVKIEEGVASPLFRVAVCAPYGKKAHLVPSALDRKNAQPTSYRFACAAALGRLLWRARRSDNTTICVAQGDYAMASERRRANAFATEFLLPREVVKGVRPGDSQKVASISEAYSISRSAIEAHARNVNNDPDSYWY